MKGLLWVCEDSVFFKGLYKTIFILFQTNLFDFLIGFALIAICFVLTYKKKKTGKVMDVQVRILNEFHPNIDIKCSYFQVLNKRILEYKPEQLTYETDASLLTRMNVELAMPKVS